MAIDIAGLKAAAAGSEEDKINWYVDQLKAGYTDAEITAAVDKALGSSYATAKAGTQEGDEWNYLQDKAAEKIISKLGGASAKEKAIAYNQLYQGAGLTNDEIQQNILDIAGEQDPEQMRALLGMAGARRASQLATGAEKADFVKQMIGYGYTPEEIVSYIDTAVGPQTSGHMSELFRLAGVQLPGSNQQQPGTDYQGTVTGGSGVDFKGSTGLREAYGPYVTDYLSRASALLGLRDSPDYQPIKFGTAEKGGTYGADTANTLANLQSRREAMMGMGEDKSAMFQPYQYSFAPKPAKSGGIMSLVDHYDNGGAVGNAAVTTSGGVGSDTVAGGMQGTQVVPSTYNAPTNTYTGPGATGITTGSFDPDAISRFTNPFTTAVTDPQVREAKRQAQLASQAQAAKFSQAGAFGGSRSILAENELGRNLATQIGDIYGKGQKEAYDAALRAFEAEEGRKLTAGVETERARQEAGRQGLTGAANEAQYQQLARDLQQRAEEATARGDQFAASLALQQLQEANRAAESARTFEYTQARDTYLDPFRELGYASQLLQGLPISASTTGISPSANALKALLASAGVLFPDETGG